MIVSVSHSLHKDLNFLNYYPLIKPPAKKKKKPPAKETPQFPWVIHFIFLNSSPVNFSKTCLNCFKYQNAISLCMFPGNGEKSTGSIIIS